MNGDSRPSHAALRWSATLVLPVAAGLLAFRHSSKASVPIDGGPIESLLVARSVAHLPESPLDTAWSQVEASRIRLARTEDRAPSVDGVLARAMVAAGEVALLLEWSDETKDLAPPLPPDPNPKWIIWGRDAVATQFPLDPHADGTLPSLVLGDPPHPVRLWLWSPDTSVEELVAIGPVSLQTSKPVATGRVRSEALYLDGRWIVMLRGKTDAPISRASPIPIAFYVWDGSSGDEGLRTNLSSWQGLVEEDPLPPGALLRGVSAGLGVLLLEWALVVARRPRC